MTKFSYQSIGPVLDSLFIDGIDHEWCFRARKHGLKVALSSSVTMMHNMGDEGFSYLGTYKPIHRSPIRHYFITRNTIYLSKLSHVPFSWKLKELLKMARRLFFYLIVSNDRMMTAILILKALLDAFKNKLGAIE
jgi:rhamnosyltransferase